MSPERGGAAWEMSSASGDHLEFQGHEDCGILHEAEIGEVFTFEVEGDGFLDIHRQCVEGGSLGDDGEIEALGGVVMVAAGDSQLCIRHPGCVCW